MLVPAMAFAWWLVSVSSAAPPDHVGAASGPVAQSGSDRQPQDGDGQPVGGVADIAEVERNGDTSGRRVPLKVVTTEIVRLAKSFLDLPMGSERPVNVDGRRYLFVLERHYHPPGFVGGPHGWHKGVTAYELK